MDSTTQRLHETNKMIVIKPSFLFLTTIVLVILWTICTSDNGPLALSLASLIFVFIVNFQIYIILGLLYVLILFKDVLQWTFCLAVCVLCSCLMFCLWLADSIGDIFLAGSKENEFEYYEAPYHRQIGNNEANNNK